MTTIPTISVSTISDVYHTLVDQGVLVSDLEKAVGVSMDDIQDLDARIPITCLSKIWEIAIEVTDDPAIGLRVGEQVDPGRFSVVAQASFQCKTVRDVLAMYARFFSIVNESSSLHVVEEDDEAIIEFRSVQPEYYCIPEIERMMSTSLARCSYLLGKKIRVKSFMFQHDEPVYLSKYESIFDAPMRFSQTTNAIVVNRGLMDVKIKHGNPYLLSVLSSYAEKLLQKITAGSDTQTKVRDFIIQHLGDEEALDVKQAAKALNMSRHTLYRKLKKENVSFQTLVENVRQEEAKKHLSDRNISISEVAFLLGFSELSAFSRAFKRWTGQSPAQFRQSIQAL